MRGVNREWTGDKSHDRNNMNIRATGPIPNRFKKYEAGGRAILNQALDFWNSTGPIYRFS